MDLTIELWAALILSLNSENINSHYWNDQRGEKKEESKLYTLMIHVYCIYLVEMKKQQSSMNSPYVQSERGSAAAISWLGGLWFQMSLPAWSTFPAVWANWVKQHRGLHVCTQYIQITKRGSILLWLSLFLADAKWNFNWIKHQLLK